MSTSMTVLVATDFSETAVQAAQTATRLVQAVGGAVHVVHVVEQIGAFGNMRFPPDQPPAMIRTLVDDAQKHFTPFLAAHVGPLPPERQHLRAGRASEEILTAAEECKADLVVLGNHGRTGLDRMTLGSVAERIIASCPVPVLTVRRAPPLGPGTRFMVATDLSRSSKAAAGVGCKLARALGGKMEFLGVLESKGGVWFLGSEPRAGKHPAEQQLREQLDAFAQGCWPDSGSVSTRILHGTPYKEIAQAAEAGADVLVMGATGQTGAMEWLLGSVVQRVSRSTTTALLTARAS